MTNVKDIKKGDVYTLGYWLDNKTGKYKDDVDKRVIVKNVPNKEGSRMTVQVLSNGKVYNNVSYRVLDLSYNYKDDIVPESTDMNKKTKEELINEIKHIKKMVANMTSDFFDMADIDMDMLCEDGKDLLIEVQKLVGKENKINLPSINSDFHIEVSHPINITNEDIHQIISEALEATEVELVYCGEC